MKPVEIKRHVLLGVFVLVGTILFLIAVFFVGNNETLFQRSFMLYAKFRDAGGLQSGGNIWLSGVKVGTVAEVDIINDSTVYMAIRIKRKYKVFLKKDVTASIGRDGVMGNRILLLHNGVSTIPVEEDQIISSASGNETSDLIATLKQSGDNLQSITKNVKEITEDIESGKGIIGELLTNEEWAQKLNTSLTRMEITSHNTATITGDLSAIIKGLRENKKGVISTLVTDTAFSRIYSQSLANIQITSKNSAQITGDFKAISAHLKNKKNAVALILTDTAFAKSLKESSVKLNEDLEAARHNFLLKGYFKQKK